MKVRLAIVTFFWSIQLAYAGTKAEIISGNQINIIFSGSYVTKTARDGLKDILTKLNNYNSIEVVFSLEGNFANKSEVRNRGNYISEINALFDILIEYRTNNSNRHFTFPIFSICDHIKRKITEFENGQPQGSSSAESSTNINNQLPSSNSNSATRAVEGLSNQFERYVSLLSSVQQSDYCDIIIENCPPLRRATITYLVNNESRHAIFNEEENNVWRYRLPIADLMAMSDTDGFTFDLSERGGRGINGYKCNYQQVLYSYRVNNGEYRITCVKPIDSKKYDYQAWAINIEDHHYSSSDSE